MKKLLINLSLLIPFVGLWTIDYATIKPYGGYWYFTALFSGCTTGLIIAGGIIFIAKHFNLI